ncbi:unnamed protein product [Absidia cylindrospora]
MDAYAVYSYCISVPNLALVDDTILSQKRQHLLYQYHDLLDAQLTSKYLTKNILKVSLSGSTTSVLQSRSDLLNIDGIEIRSIIQSIHPHIVTQQNRRLLLHKRLETLANDFGVTFSIDISPEPSIVIQGTVTRVEAARIQTLVYLDQLLDLHVDSVSLPPLLHNILGGKRHYQLQSVMEETATNIYLEPPFIIGHVGTPLQQQHGIVYISGDTIGTKRAKVLVKKLAEQKLNCLYHKESSFDPHKIDWILLHQQDQLKKLLRDNGSFIHFPKIGAGTGIIQVYAENRINTERTLRLLNHMAYSIYTATFKIKSTSIGNGGQANRDWSLEVSNFVSQLAELSGGEVVYHSDQAKIDVYGSDTSIRLAYQHLKDSKFKENHISTCISVELASEHRAFMKGKKSGKVNKIVKSCGANIKFIPAYSDYNCIVTVDSTDLDKAFYGLELLSHELPEERSFYVPEIYHRRIIGVGGKNIQRIMRKYGVYVKFSGADEFTELGGYFENEHNVFARTPRKYSSSLNQLYDEVMELITFEKDRNWISCNIKVPLHLHRIIPNRHSNALRNYGRLHNTRLWWPPRCGNADVVAVGPATQVRLIQSALSNLLPQHEYLAVPISPSLINYLDSKFILGRLKQVMKTDWSVELLEPDTNLKEIGSTKGVRWQTSYTFKNALVFQLTAMTQFNGQTNGIDDESNTTDENIDKLQSAKQFLIDQLLVDNIPQNTATKKTTIHPTITTEQNMFGAKSAMTQPDILNPFYKWESTRSYTLNGNENGIAPRRSLSLFAGSKISVADPKYPKTVGSTPLQSPTYQIPPSPTTTTDMAVPQIAKSIWSTRQPKDDIWRSTVTDTTMVHGTGHEVFDKIDSPSKYDQYWHYKQQQSLYGLATDRRSPPPAPCQSQPHPTTSFSTAAMNQYTLTKNDLFYPTSQIQYPLLDNSNGRMNTSSAATPPASAAHHYQNHHHHHPHHIPPSLSTTFDMGDMTSPTSPHFQSPLSHTGIMSPSYSTGSYEMSLPRRKAPPHYQSYLN